MIPRFLAPWKIKVLRRFVKDRPVRLLDIGAGNHSPKVFRRWLPDCHYYGLDRQRGYDLDETDFQIMEAFYQIDLDTLQFESVPDAFFDVIVFSHVIEHLPEGDKVVEGFFPKLRDGGMVYIEYPGERSLRLPSMPMTLNFYDDPTHVRVFSLPEVCGLLERNGFEILRSGTRRDWVRILLLPPLALRILLKKGHLTGGLFWDLFGFAEYVLARKSSDDDGTPGQPGSREMRAKG